MPAKVIQHVHDLAKNYTAGVTFTDKYGHEYKGDDDDDDNDDDGDPYIPVMPVDPEADEDLDGSITGVDKQELQDIQQDDLPDHDMQQDNQPDPPEFKVANESGDDDGVGSQASAAADKTAVADETVYNPAVLRELKRLSNPELLAGRTQQQR
jgi:hypothetical protein